MKPITIILLSLIALISLGFTFQNKEEFSVKTLKGNIVKVSKGIISFNHKTILKMKYDDILYDNAANTLLEDHGTTFLFVATNGNPNLDRLNVYIITPISARLVADAILSPVKDYDRDGYLEFGGHDVTEVYSNPDSMYYIPTAYYQIKNGRIAPDAALTKKMDKSLNGIYLTPALQNDRDGNCCKVIPIVARKKKL